MKRQHRRWHRLSWWLLAPVVATLPLLGAWLQPPSPLNPGLPQALENAAFESTPQDAAPTGTRR